MQVREYGQSGALVVVIHGGPGAPGSMAPLARALSADFRVVEPFQRPSGGAPLTLGRHVEDLRDLLESRPDGARPALVGSSWGAMLALAFAAAQPELAGPLVLIGCGTFDVRARARFDDNLRRRVDDELQRRIDQLSSECSHPDEELQMMGDLLLPVYSFDAITDRLELVGCDARAFRESWGDMLRLQAEGRYPAAFARITSPVLMLHGAADPHPGALIRDSLQPFISQLEYREWNRCGHYPWLERQVREEFFDVLRAWLKHHLET